MASKTDVANLALTMLGDQRITSIDPPDNTEAANVMASVWDVLRDEEQRAHAWNFCLTRAQLPADVAVPDWGYEYQFMLPSDCLRVIQVSDIYAGVSFTNYRMSNEQDYSIEGGKLLTGVRVISSTNGVPDPLKIRYLKRVESPALWDSCFIQVFAARLAVTCCERITFSASKRQLAEQEYMMALKRARRANSIEQPPIPLPDNTPVLVRK